MVRTQSFWADSSLVVCSRREGIQARICAKVSLHLGTHHPVSHTLTILTGEARQAAFIHAP